MASPDAVIRLQRTPLQQEWHRWCKIYFEEQKHDSLTEFVGNLMEGSNGCGLSIQVEKIFI